MAAAVTYEGRLAQIGVQLGSAAEAKISRAIALKTPQATCCAKIIYFILRIANWFFGLCCCSRENLAINSLLSLSGNDKAKAKEFYTELLTLKLAALTAPPKITPPPRKEPPPSLTDRHNQTTFLLNQLIINISISFDYNSPDKILEKVAEKAFASNISSFTQRSLSDLVKEIVKEICGEKLQAVDIDPDTGDPTHSASFKVPTPEILFPQKITLIGEGNCIISDYDQFLLNVADLAMRTAFEPYLLSSFKKDSLTKDEAIEKFKRIPKRHQIDLEDFKDKLDKFTKTKAGK